VAIVDLTLEDEDDMPSPQRSVSTTYLGTEVDEDDKCSCTEVDEDDTCLNQNQNQNEGNAGRVVAIVDLTLEDEDDMPSPQRSVSTTYLGTEVVTPKEKPASRGDQTCRVLQRNSIAKSPVHAQKAQLSGKSRTIALSARIKEQMQKHMEELRKAYNLYYGIDSNVDERAARKIIEKLAKKSIPTAKGDCYRCGWGGFQRDTRKALNCYLEGYKAGCVLAIGNLGDMHMNGESVDQDEKRGSIFYREGHEKGNSICTTELGIYLLEKAQDNEMPKSALEEGLRLLMIAAEKKNSNALEYLGNHYRDSNREYAFEFYQDAANKGQACSQFEVAQTFEDNGNCIKAKEWYMKFLKNRDGSSKHKGIAHLHLGRFCNDNQDFKNARIHYAKSAYSFKNPTAYFNMGLAHKDGRIGYSSILPYVIEGVCTGNTS